MHMRGGGPKIPKMLLRNLSIVPSYMYPQASWVLRSSPLSVTNLTIELLM